MSFQISIDTWSNAVEYMPGHDKRPHIDRLLYECELALNLHGVHTRYSCSGHIDKFPGYPCIIVTTHKDASFLVPEYLTLMSGSPLSENARRVQDDIISSMEETGQISYRLSLILVCRDSGT